MCTLFTQRFSGYTKTSFLPQGGIFLFLYKTSEYLHNLNNFLHLNVSNFFFYDSHLTSVQIPSNDVRLHLTNGHGSICCCFSYTFLQTLHTY